MNFEFYLLDMRLLSSLGEMVHSRPNWTVIFFWSLLMGPSHGITQAQPSFLSSASLKLLFCPVSQLRWVLHRGLCSSQLIDLSFVHPCCVPGCRLDRALWEEPRGKELPGTMLGTLTFSTYMENVSKGDLRLLPDEMHCPERGVGERMGQGINAC